MTVLATQALQNNEPSTPHNPPRASRHRPKKSANDVRVNPASTEVISNLLASLSSVSVGSDEDSPLVPRAYPRTPSPSSARPSAKHSARPSASFPRSATRPRDARDPSIDFPEVVHPPPPAVSIELPPDGDIAQPPIIRTSRRPSGYSELTAPKQPRRPPSTSSLDSQSASYDLLAVPSPSTRPVSRIAPLPRITSRNKTTSARSSSDDARRTQAMGQRDSLLVHRSKESKGKERAKHDSIDSISPDGTIGRSNSYFHMPSPRSARTYLSKHSSRTPSIQEDIEPLSAEKSLQSLHHASSSDEFVVVHGKNREKRQGIHHGRKFIPSRSSSLRHGSDSPPGSRFLSRRSSRQSYHMSPETVPEEDVDLRDGEPTIKQTDVPMLSELDEDHETVKRIRELQSAKEARQRMQAVDELPVFTTGLAHHTSPMASEGLKMPNGDVKQDQQQGQDQATATIPGSEMNTKQNGMLYGQQVTLSHSSSSNVPEAAKVQRFACSPRSPRSESTFPDGVTVDTPVADTPGKPALPSSPFRRRSKRWSNAEISPTFHRRSGSNKDVTTGLSDSVAEKVTRTSTDSVDDSIRDFLQAPRLSQKIQISHEKRQIAFSEVGDPKGHVVVCCPGMGLTRYVMAFYDELATSLKLRLITPDRPGVGDSGAYGDSRAPLHWPDDVRAICAHLKIQRFSLLAHSAGAIYALATALSMPSRIRGHIHLLAPWIPPSQLTQQRRNASTHPNGSDSSSPMRDPATPQPTVPRSQRFLRLIPTPFFKLTNAGGYLAGARSSNSPDPGSSPSQHSSPWSRKSASADSTASSRRPSLTSRVPRPSFLKTHEQLAVPPSPTLAQTPHLENTLGVPDAHSMEAAVLRAGTSRSTSRPATPANAVARPATARPASPSPRQRAYDAALTPLIWELATRNANPHIDLVVCLERQRPIGFHYADVPRAVVIRHGSRDARVPVENAVWLGGVMRGAEVRVLDGEGHGLMGRAGVMGDVLAEVAAECVR